MLNYILQVSICWCVFYLLYTLFFSKETFFHINRWYLMGTFLLGLVIPTLDFSTGITVEQTTPIITYLEPVTLGVQQIETALDEVTVTAYQEDSNLFSFWKLLIGIYLLGVIVSTLVFFNGLFRIYQLRQKSQKEAKSKYNLFHTPEVHLPFSFFKDMFWSNSVNFPEEEKQTIIKHELAHIEGLHSLDLLLIELAGIIFWFHPLIYFYKNSIRNVHEYLADSAALTTTRKRQYGQLLLRQVQTAYPASLANYFIHSQLKKRILMIKKNKSQRSTLLKYSFLLPLIAILFLAFSFSPKKDALLDFGELTIYSNYVGDFDKAKAKAELKASLANFKANAVNTQLNENFNQFSAVFHSWVSAHPEHKESIKALALEVIHDTNAPFAFSERNKMELYYKATIVTEEKPGLYKEASQMPRFPGCEDKALAEEELKKCAVKNLLMYVYTNVKYPAEARELGIQGTTVVRFIVNEKGKIESPEIIRNVGGGCGEEALRVAKMMSDKKTWTPGYKDGKAVSVYFNLPIKFKLADNDEDKEPTVTVKVEKEIDRLKKDHNGDPLIVLDGKIIQKDQMNKLKPSDIHSIDVIKGSSAVDGYGEKGVNGVVQITTNQKASDKKIAKDDNKNSNVLANLEKDIAKLKKDHGGRTLFELDGATVQKDQLSNLKASDIYSITITGPTALNGYKEKGINGLVRITTKNSAADKKMTKEDFFMRNIKMPENYNGETVFTQVDNMPRFPGCEDKGLSGDELKSCSTMELLQYIYKNIKYPAVAREKGIQGTVVSRFVIDKEGNLVGPNIARGIGGGCDEEVLRVVKSMTNKWVPGTLENGKAVNVVFNLPVKFKLEGPAKATKPIIVKELQLEQFKAFPNPAQNQITVRFQGEKMATTVTLLDENGQSIQSENFNNFDGSFDKNYSLDGLPKGIYFLQVTQNGKSYVEKIVVQ